MNDHPDEGTVPVQGKVNQGESPLRVRRLTDIKFGPELTAEKMNALWGSPDSDAGYAANYTIYDLGNDEQLLLLFDIERPYKLTSAGVASRKTGKVRQLFDRTSWRATTFRRKLSDVALGPMLTRGDVTSKWGLPEGRRGPRGDYDCFTLETRQEVWLRFNTQPPYRLSAAELFTCDTGVLKILIADGGESKGVKSEDKLPP